MPKRGSVCHLHHQNTHHHRKEARANTKYLLEFHFGRPFYLFSLWSSFHVAHILTVLYYYTSFHGRRNKKMMKMR